MTSVGGRPGQIGDPLRYRFNNLRRWTTGIAETVVEISISDMLNRLHKGATMIYIIGSGPAGIAAATAFVKRGIRPTILDVGVEPDLASIALKTRLARLDPAEWAPEDVALAKG